MRLVRPILVTALAGAALALPATAATPKLVGTVGPGFTITLTQSGKAVKSLKAGKYTIVVADKSSIHNFHLTGPGVNKASGVDSAGTKTWTVTLKKGTYKYVCDPHEFSMKGSFKVL